MDNELWSRLDKGTIIHIYIYTVVHLIIIFIEYFIRKNRGNSDDNLIKIKKE